jgi:hypothetical protein
VGALSGGAARQRAADKMYHAAFREIGRPRSRMKRGCSKPIELPYATPVKPTLSLITMVESCDA